MTTKAYVLIETAVGRSSDIVTQLHGLAGVETVDPVTGPYDIIAIIFAADLNSVGDLVTGHIHTIDGIVRTVTCLSINNN